MKACKTCGKSFKPNKSGLMCDKCYVKDYNLKNKNKILIKKSIWIQTNQDKIKKQRDLYYENNKTQILEKQKVYRIKNKDKVKKYHKDYRVKNAIRLKEKHKKEQKEIRNKISNRLRFNISRSIRHCLFKINKSKNRKSIIDFLPYTINELKYNLESKFEPWMNWKNYGVYRISTWDDNDSNTWTWQIDHITPHSCFKYDSMNHHDFQKCWALENLRPYSAKQNIIDQKRL